MSAESKQLRISPTLEWQDVGGELVAVDVDSGEYHIFNGVGRVIWEGIGRGESVSQIVASVLDRYESTPEAVSQDVNCFVDRLTAKGIVSWS